MAEFINSGIKSIKPEEDTGIMLPPPIATVKFDVWILGKFMVDVKSDGSWTMARELYDEEWRKKHFEISYNQGFIDGCRSYEKNHREDYKDFTSCSEKLPEEDGCYLVYAPNYSGGSSSTKEIHDGVMFSNYKNGKWSIEVGYYKRPGCVKAWMPIPKYRGDIL